MRLTEQDIAGLGLWAWLRRRAEVKAYVATAHTALTSTVERMSGELEKAKYELDQAQTRLSAAEGDVDAYKAEVKDLKSKLNDAENQVAHANDRLADMRAKYEAIQRDLEAEKRLVSETAKAWDETKAELRDVRGKYDELLGRKETVGEKAIRERDAEISDLKSRLASERLAHSKTHGHVQKLWNFIALRNKPVDEAGLRRLISGLPQLFDDKKD